MTPAEVLSLHALGFDGLYYTCRAISCGDQIWTDTEVFAQHQISELRKAGHETITLHKPDKDSGDGYPEWFAKKFNMIVVGQQIKLSSDRFLTPGDAVLLAVSLISAAHRVEAPNYER